MDRYTIPLPEKPINRAARRRGARDFEAEITQMTKGRERLHTCHVCRTPTALMAKIDGIHSEHRPYCTRCYSRRMFKLSG